jgi:hypothetical protein
MKTVTVGIKSQLICKFDFFFKLLAGICQANILIEERKSQSTSLKDENTNGPNEEFRPSKQTA